MSTSRLLIMVICAAIFKIAHLPLSMFVPPKEAILGVSVVPVLAGWRGFQRIMGLYWAAVLASKRVRPWVLKFGGRTHRARGSSTIRLEGIDAPETDQNLS